MSDSTYPWPVTEDGTILVLRTSNADGTSHHASRFQWPAEGPVEAPDWNPRAGCGGGLHGLAWGTGGFTLDTVDALWQVVEVGVTDLVNLGDKVKFRRGIVVHSDTDMAEAVALIADHPLAAGLQVAHATRTAGRSGTATAGDWGTATAGYRGTATAGYRGTATAGDWGTATAGRSGTATAGRSGTATAGYSGTATAGYWGTATAGDWGTATAGDWGVLIIQQYDADRDIYLPRVAIVGENGIEPDVAYRLDGAGLFVPAEANQ